MIPINDKRFPVLYKYHYFRLFKFEEIFGSY